ncbi:MAG TPA: UDP-N-acetylglucosamine 2-epimerase (non-hydrolyzing) [Gemmatimonadales bacterium]|jgi:UDP-GlcNAc3NAcA epimerase|nr:UDP-N-acetylglucosamine 2-epimerase (non-hydrolyzing) [Gemmatimonadales bacterium]
MTVSRLLALCYGTRPQIIKASVLRNALARVGNVAAVDTGQHYDFALNQLLYQQLGVSPPDHFLEVGSGSHGAQTALLLERAEDLLRQLRPDAVIVIGDTNSTLGSALAAVKLRIPVVHVEAGLRADDRLMPEEINRRVTDAVASVLCAPSDTAARRLERERPDARVVRTGDIARDVLLAQAGRLPAPETIHSAALRPYAFATLHRAELTENLATLRAVLEAMSCLPLRTVLALHPRTRDALERAGTPVDSVGSLVVIPAVGYLESLALTGGASVVITDSGGLQREAYWQGVPCLTVRRETEWAETVELGANLLLPPEEAAASLGDAVTAVLSSVRASWSRNAYGDGHAADRIAQAVADGAT